MVLHEFNKLTLKDMAEINLLNAINQIPSL